MIPPRFVPPGVLQLYEVIGDERTLVEELSTSAKNRDKINQLRNQLLMINPTKQYIISENNALPKSKVHHPM